MAEFNPDDFLKKTSKQSSDFDPDTFLSKFETQKQAKPERKSEAVLEGFGEAATLGYLNNLQGGTEAAISFVHNKLKGLKPEDPEYLDDGYAKARDYYNQRQKKLSEENPKSFAAGQVAGTIASSVPVMKAAQGATATARALQAAKAGSIYGGLQNTNTDEAKGKTEGLNIADRITNAGAGMAIGAGASLGTDLISKGVKSTAQAVGGKLKKSAEKLAENATGATRVQADKFSDDAGRFLLDNKIVQFGDDAEKIAEKANASIKTAEGVIDKSLKTLDSQGVKISQDKIVADLGNTIKSLEKDPSKADVVRKLKTIQDDIINTGESELSATNAEQVKRGFNKMAKNWQEPNQGEAGKIAYRAYRDAVEDTAKTFDPKLAGQFKDAKQVYGKLSPISDAAEKRTAQRNLSPWAGLLDVSAAVGGMAMGDPSFGVGSILARRIIAPRLASSAAVTTDAVSKQLLKIPQYSQLAQSNPSVFKTFAAGVANDIQEYSKLRGFEKFAQDGEDNLLSVGVDPATIEKLKQDKKGRQLLIEASSAKPDSKMMKSVLSKVRTGYLQQEEGE